MTTAQSSELTVAAPDGRRIAVQISGPPDGTPILFCHAAPGSRHFDPDPTANLAAGSRLISVDRPGYGRSEPLESLPLLSIGTSRADSRGNLLAPIIPGYADDCALVLDELGVETAAVAGWSAGGRVALALAARRPDLVRSVAVIATPAPDEEVAWIGPDEKSMIAALSADPGSAQASLEGMLAPMTADPEARLGMVGGGAAEQAALTDSDLRSAVEAMLSEAFVQGPAGLAADILSYTMAPWGFDPRAVGAPVRCWYGADDAVVSPAHGQWWVDQVADGTTVAVPKEGHLLVRSVWADVLAWFADTK